MARQTASASPHKLYAYLGRALDVLDALGYNYIPTDHNPVWLALAGLNPVSVDEIRELVDSGEMTEEEAANFTAAVEQGAELADKLRPVLWKGKTSNKNTILQAYAIAQTACVNVNGGPIGTGELGTIRQRWYFSKLPLAMGFKFAAQQIEAALIKSADVVLVDDERAYARARKMGAGLVAYKTDKNREWLVHLANDIGVVVTFELRENRKALEKAVEKKLGRPIRTHIWPKAGWGRTYAQLQSGILADAVRTGLTYDELWCRDASREIFRANPLLPGFHGVLILEKEGLFEHFRGFCRAAGVPILLAMGGNNAFSCVEAILNDHFRDYNGCYRPTADNPLHLFVISDHDYYGWVPVQEGAAEQFRRYLPDAVEVHRVGITPDQLRALGRSAVQAGYEFEHDYNATTEEWANAEGVWIGGTCYAIEVEALTPGEYIPALIDAIVEAVGGDEELRKRLAEMAEPDWYDAQARIQRDTYPLSELWKHLVALYDWAQEKSNEAEQPVDDFVQGTVGYDGDPDAWRERDDVAERIQEIVSEQRDAIDMDKFTDFVQSGGNNWSAWAPVGSAEATAAVVELFHDEFDDDLEDTATGVDTDNASLLNAVRDVFDRLEEFGLELS